MLCPNCNQPMNLVIADDQKILHCSNCGGSFFEENGINKITLNTAQTLAEDKKSDEISSNEKKCPKDQTLLKPILPNCNQSHQISSHISDDITLLHCQKCRGIFAYPDDLISLKKTQVAKIEYYKHWQLPLNLLKKTIILGVGALIFTAVIVNYTYFQKALNQANASDLIKKLYLSRSANYLFLFFKTEKPFRSKVIFQDATDKKIIKKILSPQPKTIHQLTTTEINLENDIYYQIVLTQENGLEIKTEVKRLIMNN